MNVWIDWASRLQTAWVCVCPWTVLGEMTWLPPTAWAGEQPGCDICQSNDGQDSLATPTLLPTPQMFSPKDYLAFSYDWWATKSTKDFL